MQWQTRLLGSGFVYSAAKNGYIQAMSTAEMIYEKAKTLPETLQTEALHYVYYLLARREDRDEEAVEWTRLSAHQLARAYGNDEPEYTTADLRK